MDSRSERISCNDFVPSLDRSSSSLNRDRYFHTYTFRKLVAANNCVLFGASSTLVIEITGSNTRKYTTASTATVTESLVKI